MTTQGERIYPDAEGQLNFSKPGQYGRTPKGRWSCSIPVPAPEAIKGIVIGGLGKHDVTEHEDGTITVSPSILVEHWSGVSWHGYLERGVWREV